MIATAAASCFSTLLYYRRNIYSWVFLEILGSMNIFAYYNKNTSYPVDIVRKATQNEIKNKTIKKKEVNGARE